MPWLSWIISNILLALVLALAAWIMQRWLHRPTIAHILWVLVLVKLVTPPLVSVPLSESSGSTACVLGTCGCSEHTRSETFAHATLPWVLLAVWLAGAGATGWCAWRRWTRFRRLLAHAQPVPAEWQTLATRLTSELSLRCRPEILSVPGRLPPLVVPGRPRSRLFLPMALMGQLNAPQRVALLLHELIHIKRGDHLVRILELIVGVAYWWLPFVGLIGRQMRACEESCCDAAVVAHRPRARRDYARLLLDVFDFANPLPGQAVPQATAMSVAKGFEQRLLAILDANQGTRSTWPAATFAAGLACAILPCKLHYDFVGLPTPVAMSITEPEPAAGPTGLPNGDHQGKLAAGCCCPS